MLTAGTSSADGGRAPAVVGIKVCCLGTSCLGDGSVLTVGTSATVDGRVVGDVSLLGLGTSYSGDGSVLTVGTSATGDVRVHAVGGVRLPGLGTSYSGDGRELEGGASSVVDGGLSTGTSATRGEAGAWSPRCPLNSIDRTASLTGDGGSLIRFQGDVLTTRTCTFRCDL